MRHVLTLSDLTTAEIRRIFAIAADLKDQLLRGQRAPLLAGRVMGLLFEKPSLRTRVSFESGMAQLGGSSLFLGEDVGWGKREAMSDFARVLSGYVDVIVCRARGHAVVERLAADASCPVINGLTDLAHPCQALADLFTLQELAGSLKDQKLAFIGDANNVARSLVQACARLGVAFAIASPPDYGFEASFLAQLQNESPHVEIVQTEDPVKAVQGATAIYTDVWASMGQEAEQAQRARDFAPYQVTEALVRQADPEVRFLHCLPARRGEEVTDSVMDGAHSCVFQQANNRLHLQKALLVWLLVPEK